MDYTKIEQYAPYIIFILLFVWQNNIFVRPDQLEKKHREILDDVDARLKGSYVELNAYKEFQSHVLKELEDVNRGINEVKDILIGRGQ